MQRIDGGAFTGTGYYNNKGNWENGLLYIGNYLINSDIEIETAEIREGTVLAAESAFENRAALKAVTVPESISFVSSGMFYNCSALESINLPGSITRIEGEAFSGCSGLMDFSVPENVTDIEPYAFADCYNLKSITIPESVEYIGMRAFYSDCCTIFCVPGSYAESFAKENGIPYSAITAKTLDSVSITELPFKTAYIADTDCLDVSGGKITLYYADGTFEIRDMTADMVTGFDNTAVGIQTLTVNCGGKTDTFEITVVSLRESDLNGDGGINIKDFIRLKKYLADPSAFGAAQADTNGDGRTDSADLVFLEKYLLTCR